MDLLDFLNKELHPSKRVKEEEEARDVMLPNGDSVHLVTDEGASNASCQEITLEISKEEEQSPNVTDHCGAPLCEKEASCKGCDASTEQQQLGKKQNKGIWALLLFVVWRYAGCGFVEQRAERSEEISR